MHKDTALSIMRARTFKRVNEIAADINGKQNYPQCACDPIDIFVQI